MSADSALRYDRLVEAAGGLAGSHRWLIDRVPEGATVLDCGCAGGYVADALSRNGCTVDGIEIDPRAARSAEAACRRVFVGSLDDEDFLRGLGPVYDRVLCGDVLEHLPRPQHTLAVLATLLAPGGRVLVSMPNIAYWAVRLALLGGRFRYKDSGILDRTHLRFYTYHTARRLAEDAGLRVVRQDFTSPATAVPIAGPLIRPFARLLPNLFAYQSLLELEPARA